MNKSTAYVSVCVHASFYLDRLRIEGAENEGVGSSVVMQRARASCVVVLSTKLRVSVSSATDFMSS